LEHAGSKLLSPKLFFIESITGSCFISFKLETQDAAMRTRAAATEDFIVQRQKVLVFGTAR